MTAFRHGISDLALTANCARRAHCASLGRRIRVRLEEDWEAQAELISQARRRGLDLRLTGRESFGRSASAFLKTVTYHEELQRFNGRPLPFTYRFGSVIGLHLEPWGT